MHKLGIDIGGTAIKFGVLNEQNEIIYKTSIDTETASLDKLIDDIGKMCENIMKEYPIVSIGVGAPGRIRNGLLTSGNLPFKNTDLKKLLEDRIKFPVKFANDANCAVWAEACMGVGSEFDNIVMITLGTGVGGGIVIDNKLYEGRGAAGEIGHITMELGGIQCQCGRKGCLEQYASARALVRKAVEAANNNPDSIINELYRHSGKLDGRLILEALNKNCPVTKAVFDEYIYCLAAAIDSIIMVFDPQVVIISGGISNYGDTLMKPLLSRLTTNVEIRLSELKNDAGICGAALL